MAFRRLRRLAPWSNAGLALWAYRNRTELTSVGAFGLRSMRKLASGDAADVAAEARLRAGLLRDARTRRATDLHVEVRDRVARLTGSATPEAHLAALRIAEGVGGVDRVLDAVAETGKRNWRGKPRPNSD